ncbi:MAG: hypothetical protein IJY82_02995 [Oscillospiraceae bacterium]|nr:hypothetical protein [Oscillospiraceae bacterium]
MYIIRNLLRYIISPYGCISSSRRICTLARDEIQGRLAALDDIHDCVVMICQACGLDKKRSNFCLPKVTSFLAMGYEKDIFGIFAYEFELTSECVIS